MVSRNKFIWLFFSLLAAQICLAQTEPGFEAKFPAMYAWDMQFKKHLLNSEQPELQVYGLMLLLPGVDSAAADDDLFEQYKAVIISLGKEDVLSPQAFVILNSVCGNQKVAEVCEPELLNEKQLQLYPDDLMSYFLPLAAAMNLDIEGEVINLVRRMANTETYSKAMHYGDVLETEFLAYVKENPFSETMLQEGLDDQLTWFHQNEELSQQALATIESQLPSNLILMRKISFDLSMPIAPYRGLMDACKAYDEIQSECLIIGKKLSELSEEYIDIIVGMTLVENIYKNKGDIKRYEQALAEKKAKKDEMECLGKLVADVNIFKNNQQDMSERIRIAREQGERPGLIYQANRLYQRAKSQGKVDAELVNPEQCLTEK